MKPSQHLKRPQTVRNLKPVSEGGVALRIKHSDSEWLILENRQQKGWDKYIPGHGMLLTKIDYSYNIWENNTPNNDKSNLRIDIIEADGKSSLKLLKNSALPPLNPYIA